MFRVKRNALRLRNHISSGPIVTYISQRTLKLTIRISNAQDVVKNDIQRPFLKLKRSGVIKNIQKVTRKTKRDTTDETSRDNILKLEIQEMLEKFSEIGTLDNTKNSEALIEAFLFSRNRPETIVDDIDIIFQTSEGEGLGIILKDYAGTLDLKEKDLENKYTIVKVPKSIIGDKVSVRLLRHHRQYAEAELINVSNYTSNSRKDDLIICEKFSSCSGCQLQMLHYEDQLAFKKTVIQRAYKYFYPKLFSNYGSEDIGHIIESPLQYAYRTKLTPHYELSGSNIKDYASLNIGFNNINPTKPTVDVEYCPIATPAINKSLPAIRTRTKEILRNELENRADNKKYKKNRGSTLLLRESIRLDHKTGEYERVCLSEHSNIITEKVDDFLFQYPASEFFQNNSSILPQLLDYIRYQISKTNYPYKYIVDTYCGSGFFGISLSRDIPEDGKIFGIEVSKLSIEHATHNAKMNGLPVPEKIQFIEGNANSIFEDKEFIQSGIIGQDSIVIMDPSRKGSNKRFMKQLLEFKPKLIIYVSCNVFTQARDLADLNELQTNHTCKYKVREIVGFDFFPQTKHVESVAILELED